MYPGIKQEKNEFSSNNFEKPVVGKIIAAMDRDVKDLPSEDMQKKIDEIGKAQLKAIGLDTDDNTNDTTSNAGVIENDRLPEPILFDDNVLCSKFDQNDMPDLLWKYINTVADHTQIAKEFVWGMAMPVLSTAAMARAQVEYNNHIEPLPLFTLNVLPSGNRKSSCLTECLKPLNLIQKKFNAILKDKILKTNEEIIDINTLIEQKRSDRKKALKKGDADMVEALKDEIVELQKKKPEPLMNCQLYTQGNITQEALFRCLQDHDGKIGLFEAEGGIFKILSGYYSNGTPSVDLLNHGYSGEEYNRGRITNNGDKLVQSLPEVLISMGLAVQPYILMPKNDRTRDEFMGTGLYGRFIYIIPESKVGSIEYKTPRICRDIANTWAETVKNIYEIKPIINEYGTEEKTTLLLSEDAATLHKRYFDDMQRSMIEGGKFKNFPEWANKASGNCARIAALYHLILIIEDLIFYNITETSISARTMQMAIDTMRKLESHAVDAYQRIGLDEISSRARAVFNLMVERRQESYTNQQAWQAFRHLIPSNRSKALDAVMDVLANRYIVFEIPVEGEPHKAGRPSKCNYRINPKIFKTH